MKLLKAIYTGLSTLLDLIIATLGVAFVLAFLSGVITLGCTKSFWTNQTVCTMTAVFNSLK